MYTMGGSETVYVFAHTMENRIAVIVIIFFIIDSYKDNYNPKFEISPTSIMSPVARSTTRIPNAIF